MIDHTCSSADAVTSGAAAASCGELIRAQYVHEGCVGLFELMHAAL